MTRDDIIRMAREAGIPVEFDWAGRPSTLAIKDGGTYLRGINDLERFAAIVAAAERESMRREWQNLTDDEIKKILGPLGSWGPTPIKGYTRKLFDEIEAALKEKNA